MNHFTRLVELTSADEQYVADLAMSLAPCILRPRQDTSLTMEEKHAYRLIRDLFANKDAVFGELKRMSSLNHSGSVTSNRNRAISNDESNRRMHMEERQRALAEKAHRGRAVSPAPGPRSHRRDRSTGGPDTRFPIQTSPTTHNDRHRSSLGLHLGSNRTSLEVPDGAGLPPAEVNGSANGGDVTPKTSDAEKRDSQGRSGNARFVAGKRVSNDSASSTPTTPKTTDDQLPDRGVTLSDKPMDD